MSNELALPAEGRVLDVGCGTGWFTRQLAALSGLQVTGIDLDADSLAFARNRDARSTYQTTPKCPVLDQGQAIFLDIAI